MLDPRQKEACDHFTGPCLTLAGPGSGKTTVLVHRIISLITERKVPPQQILVITFTKDAAIEMQKRFLSMYSDLGRKDGNTVVFGTFHSVFYHILRSSNLYKNVSLISEKDKMRLFLDAAKDCGLKEPDMQLLQQLSKEVSYAANVGKYTSEEDGNNDSAVYSPSEFEAFSKAYDSLKRKNNCIDFDDMLVRCYELFQRDEKLLCFWQERFSQILVDEAQDMNQIQFQVLKLLAFPHKNIFIVGDDDQSIYGFRGADPSILREFQESYENTHTVCLSVNYRSASLVVTQASRMISNNKMRFPKEIQPFQTTRGRVVTKVFPDGEKEALALAMQCKKYMETKNHGTVAILFRKRRESANVIRHLTRMHVPFYMREKITTIYEHWITNDMICYIKAAAEVAKPKDYLSIANRPNRYIRRESLDMEVFSWERWISYYDDRDWMQERIKKMRRDMETIEKMSPFAAINYIRKAIGYDRYIKENGLKLGIAEDEGLAVLDEVQRLAAEEKGSGIYHLRQWLKKMEEGKIESEKSKGPTAFQGVGLYTFHGSKGLEFDRVYIIDVNETVTPANKNDDPVVTEEERRMFYVACTRAKKELYLYSVEQIRGRKVAPSRFLKEMQGEPNN